MRARVIVQVLSLAIVVAAGVIWMKSRAAAVELQTRMATLATRPDTLRRLVQERDHLRFALAEALRQQQASGVATPLAETQPASPSGGVASWPLGEWRSAREWRNEGQSTPRTTVGTLLWAAAGGDLDAMTRIIAFDDAGRKEAQALFDTLPLADRQAFPTPETLVAGLTMMAVSDNAAQLSWFHERDDNHATVGLLLGTPNKTAPTEVTAVARQGNRPAMLADDGTTKLTVLSLQRSPMGWRVVIPAAAVARLAHQPKRF